MFKSRRFAERAIHNLDDLRPRLERELAQEVVNLFRAKGGFGVPDIAGDESIPANDALYEDTLERAEQLTNVQADRLKQLVLSSFAGRSDNPSILASAGDTPIAEVERAVFIAGARLRTALTTADTIAGTNSRAERFPPPPKPRRFSDVPLKG